MAGANLKPPDRKSRWESDSAALKNSQLNASDSKSIIPGSINFNKKSTPLSSQFKTGPNPSNRHHQSSTPQQPDPFSYSDLSQLGPPLQPTYGFHMLLRKSILLADGTVRSYFALPPDYEELAARLPPLFDGSGQFRGGKMSPDGAMHGRGERESQDYWKSLGLDNMDSGRVGEGGMKRKFGDEESDRVANDGEYSRQRLQYGDVNSTRSFNDGGSGSGIFRRQGADDVRNRLSHGRIDSDKLKKEFLRFVKMINETGAQRKKYLEDGKKGSLRCLACGRSSKEFSDTHGLIMHTYHSDNADLLPGHLGLHKALCVLMGWNYSEPPDDSKSYQSLSAAEVVANRNDLIMWPPVVIIHNTRTGKNKEGRMEGLGNKVMDARLKELGFTGGKVKSLHGKEGHQGITLVKFTGNPSGLKEAIRLSEFLEKENHGRKNWAYVKSTISRRKNEDDNPSLVYINENSKEKTRILYGYLATPTDQDKLDSDTKKKIVVQSIRETLK